MNEDQASIEEIIARQFGSLNWTPNRSGNWNAFIGDFLPDAALYPAVRPAKRQAPSEFMMRMKGLSESKLKSFREDVLGHQIRVFGNIAIAAVGCQITENDTEINRTVEMMLFIKEDGAWRIVAQAWDSEGDSKRLPPDLLKRPGD